MRSSSMADWPSNSGPLSRFSRTARALVLLVVLASVAMVLTAKPAGVRLAQDQALGCSAILDSVPCSDAPTPIAPEPFCEFMEVDARDYSGMIHTSLLAEEEYVHEVSRSVAGGAFVWIETLAVGEIEFVDKAVPAGSVSYSVESVDAHEVVRESYVCEEDIYVSPGVSDVGMSALLDGTIGAVSAGNLPAPVRVPALPDPVTELVVGDVPGNCAARLRVDIASQSDPWVKVTIPSGLTMRGDVLNRKNGTDSGNWSGSFAFYEVAADGGIGALSSNSTSVNPTYNWASLSQDMIKFRFFKNDGPTRDFYVRFDLVSVSSISPTEGAFTEMVNVAFYDDAGDLVSTSCIGELVDACAAAGGNLLFEVPTEVGGTTYEGCNNLDDECLTGMADVGNVVPLFTCSGQSSFVLDIQPPSTLTELGIALLIVGDLVYVPANAAVLGGDVVVSYETLLGASIVIGGFGLFEVAQVDGSVQTVATVDPLNMDLSVQEMGPLVALYQRPVAELPALDWVLTVSIGPDFE